MPAQDILENFENGSPVSEIAENFRIRVSDVQAVLEYAASRQTVK